MLTNRQRISTCEEIAVTESKEDARSVEFVGWGIMGLVIKARDDWRDVERPSSCNASQLPPFLRSFKDKAL